MYLSEWPAGNLKVLLMEGLGGGGGVCTLLSEHGPRKGLERRYRTLNTEWHLRWGPCQGPGEGGCSQSCGSLQGIFPGI